MCARACLCALKIVIKVLFLIHYVYNWTSISLWKYSVLVINNNNCVTALCDSFVNIYEHLSRNKWVHLHSYKAFSVDRNSGMIAWWLRQHLDTTCLRVTWRWDCTSSLNCGKIPTMQCRNGTDWRLECTRVIYVKSWDDEMNVDPRRWGRCRQELFSRIACNHNFHLSSPCAFAIGKTENSHLSHALFF